MSVIFIAIPTKGTVKDRKLTKEFLSYLAQLHLDTDNTYIAPMVQDYALLEFMPDVEATWEDWGKHCRAIIPRCDEVWVLKFPGYATSVGVAGEVQCAKEHGIPVVYKDI